MFVCCTERHNKLKTVKAMTRWQICTTTTMCWCTRNCSTTPRGWSYSEETSLHLFLTNSEAFSSTEECWCPSQISVMNIFNSFQHMCLSIIHTNDFSNTLLTEVSASFTSSVSVVYILKEPYELSSNSSVRPSSIYSEISLRGENISLSFRTSQSPALLLYINSFFKEYLALLINKHGEITQTSRFN